MERFEVRKRCQSSSFGSFCPFLVHRLLLSRAAEASATAALLDPTSIQSVFTGVSISEHESDGPLELEARNVDSFAMLRNQRKTADRNLHIDGKAVRPIQV